MHWSIPLLLLGAATLVWAADTKRMLDFRMAVLIKNGQLTSCMVPIMTLKAGFVAANCIDLTGDNKVNMSTKYKVRFTSTNDIPNGFEVDLDPSDIAIHPNYNSKSLANNIAVVQYNKATTDTFKAYIVAQKYAENTQVYVQRDYSQETGNWNDPVVYNQAADSSECTAISSLYAQNKDWFTCTSSATTLLTDSGCTMPYGIVYSENSTSTDVVTTALYSHSYVGGTSLCGNSVKTINYYTVLSKYMGFAVSVLGTAVDVFVLDMNQKYTDNTILSMSQPTVNDMAGANVVSGNLFLVEKSADDIISSAPVSSAVSSSSSESESKTAKQDSATDSDSNSNSNLDSDSLETDQPANEDDAEAVATNGHAMTDVFGSSGNTGDTESSSNSSNGGGGGLSKGLKIAIGLTVSLGGILVIIGSFILLHIWKSKRQDKAWDPSSQVQNLQEIAFQLDTSGPEPVPPPYTREDTALGASQVARPKDSVYLKKG
ncbi:hypothetical protein IWW48_004464 [Coemansia sp. RSA 1200]|nr:hypothetical protein IWW48_004464 [Coemansia sp. RSA 1200]